MARHLLQELEDSVESALAYSHSFSLDLVGLRNAVQTGRLIAEAAANNPVSCGTHFVEDVLSDPLVYTVQTADKDEKQMITGSQN